MKEIIKEWPTADRWSREGLWEMLLNLRGEGQEQTGPRERKKEKGISGKVSQHTKSSRRGRAQFV